jgi:hypothetical protein
MPEINNDIGSSYQERRDNTPNAALQRLMAEPPTDAAGKPQVTPGKQEELPFMAKHPNLYGMYGAAKEVGKSLLPWVKYIDPEEREKFSQLSTEQQTRDLLMEDLNFALLGRWKPIESAVKSIGGAALETFMPKTYARLIAPIGKKGVAAAPKEAIPPAEAPPIETPPVKAGEVSPKAEIVEPGATLGGNQPLTLYHGTNADFATFDNSLQYSRGQMGMHLGDKEAAGNIFGDTPPKRIIPIEVDIKNPLRLEDLGAWQGADVVEMVNEKIGSKLPLSAPDSAIREAIKKAGYDGVVYENKFESSIDGVASDSYIAFSPKQIKLSPSPLPEAGAKSGGNVPPVTPIDIPVIDSDDAFKQVQKLADEWDNIIETQRRGTRTHLQARQEGALLGMTPDDAKAITPGTAMNDGQASALIDVVNGVANEVHGLAKKAVETGTPEDMQSFLKKFLALGEVDPARWGVRTEGGRTLSVMNEPISGINQYLDQFSNALQASGTMTPERLAKMVSDLKDVGSLAKIAGKAAKQGPVDMLMEVWINGLLSGPVSHAANISGNTLTMLLQPATRFGAAVSGAVLPGEQAVPFGESAHMLYGMVMGLKDAFRLSGKALIEGKPTRGDATKLDWKAAITGENMGFSEGSDIGRAIDLLGETVRLPGRALMAEDEFFKAIAYRMELHARAYREGVANGFEREDLTRFIAEETRNPSKEISNAAEEFAKYVTYQKDLGQTGQALQALVATHPTLKIILPFVRTPANIFKFAGEMTPLAPFSNAVRQDIAAGGAKRDLALSKIALGTSMMTVVASYVAEGKITGAGPSDPELKAALLRTGWQPNAIKIGKNYYQYGRLEPISTLLGIAASSAEIAGQVDTGDIEYDKLPSAVIMAISKNVVDKTFLQGVTKIIEAIEDPDRYGKRYIRGMAGTVVPALSAQAARSMDKDIKAVNSVMDSVKSRIPGFSKDILSRLDLWGEPIKIDTWGPMIVSPVRKSEIKESPADSEIVNNKVQITMPDRHINGVELTPKEYNRFVELAGRDAKGPQGMGAKEAVETLIQSPNYQRQSEGPDGGRALMLKTTIYAYREMARKMMLQESPELAEKVMEGLQKKQQSMTAQY